MQAIAYMRVSTDDQKLGIPAQREAITRYAKTHDIEIVSWHADEGISGAANLDERPGLAAALAMLDDYPGAILLAYKRDRIARDALIAAVIDRHVEQRGGSIRTADGLAYDQTPESKLMRTMMDAFAEYERAIIRQRTKMALQVKKVRGERCGGPAPFGYMWDGQSKVKHPTESRILEQINMMRQQNMSYHFIAQSLNEMGIPSRRGAWHVTSIKRVLDAYMD